MYLRALKQIFRVFFAIFLIATIPVVLFTLITSKTSLFGIKSYVVLTGSMGPNLPAGSVIYILKQPSYQVGDVIAFKQGSITISHRIVDVNSKGYQTKGDANNVVDSNIVSKDSVQGAQIYRLFNLGKLVLFLKTTAGLISLIVIPAFILIGFEVWNIKKELEKEITRKLLKQISERFSLSNE